MTHPLALVLTHVRAKARPGQYDAILLAEVDRLRAGIQALSDIYRKTDGTMRTCNRNATIICNERLCHVNGCARANDILKATKETGDV